MDFVGEYAANVDAVLKAIWQEERPAIDEAGRMLARSLEADGMLYVFGCGHSHMIEEELFYRAGGLGARMPPVREQHHAARGGCQKQQDRAHERLCRISDRPV